MRLRVSRSDLAGDLLRFLQQRVDVVAAEVAHGELEVSLLGSRRELYNRIELDTRIKVWQQAHPDVEVAFVDE
jgi:hypothetical protein